MKHVFVKITGRLLFIIVTGILVSHQGLAATSDNPLLGTVILDQFEYSETDNNGLLTWDGQAWLGYDLNKLWLKTEGEQTDGNTESFELQALYSKALARYWDFQLGIRYDAKPGPESSWGVIGLQGLAPYFFDISSALFIGDSGETALRLIAEYELLFTQKLILSPQVEINFYGQNDTAKNIGSGLSEIEFGLRLRYEIRREFAPYFGINFWKKYGNTADFSRAAGEIVSDTQMVAGIRVWF